MSLLLLSFPKQQQKWVTSIFIITLGNLGAWVTSKSKLLSSRDKHGITRWKEWEMDAWTWVNILFLLIPKEGWWKTNRKMPIPCIIQKVWIWDTRGGVSHLTLCKHMPKRKILLINIPTSSLFLSSSYWLFPQVRSVLIKRWGGDVISQQKNWWCRY